MIQLINDIYLTFQEKSKTWKVSFLIHQGISVELFSLLLLKLVVSDRYEFQFILSVVAPFVAFTLLKIYSWLVILSFMKLQKEEERKAAFGTQWITNSILGFPNVGFSLPAPEIVESKERF